MKPFIPIVSLIFILTLAGADPCRGENTWSPPPVSEVNKIVSSLPWNFSLIRRDITGTGFPFFTVQPPPASLIAYRFVSREPVATSSHGRTYLRLDLFAGHFNSIKDASLCYRQIKESANPDTGISYQWDIIALAGQNLYHLHADCLLSEKYFDILRDAFLVMLSRRHQNEPTLLFCRCGRGCS